MAALTKIDSNVTGLSYAEEESYGVLPSTPLWIPLEPNAYNDFGGQIKTVARNPINNSRQRKKGVTVDLDSAGGFESDLTQTNLQDLMQGFLFADARTKSEFAVAVITGANQYTIASGGLAAFQADDLIFAKQFDESSNNGLKRVTARTATLVTVAETLVAASGQEGVISRVGYRFDSGILSVNVAGTWPKLIAANVAATNTLDITADTIIDGEIVTIDGVAYTFESGAIDPGVVDTSYEVDLGVDDQTSLENLYKAITATGVAGTDYSANLVAHPTVTAASPTDPTLVMTALVTGEKGNLLAASTTISGATIGATFTGGAGRDLTTLGIIPGEWIYVGGDDPAAGGDSFNIAAGSVDNGFKRVRSVTQDYIELDKSATTMLADAGTGQLIRLYFGRVLKNEAGGLIVRRTYQLERTLGAPESTQPAQIQSEYIVGAVPNEFKIDLKTADKTTVELSFVGSDHETRSGATGVKSGTRQDLVEAAAFNNSSDIARVALTPVSDGNENPTPYFAFLTDTSISIKNNVKGNKAVGVLGNFEVTAGTFEVMAEAKAYFADVASVQAVRDNTDASFDIIFAPPLLNNGIAYDIPLVSVGDARADVKQDEAIMLPIEVNAATAAKIAATLNHTLLIVYFDYLPTAASA